MTRNERGEKSVRCLDVRITLLALFGAVAIFPVFSVEPIATGPEIGNPIPPFEALDQYGKIRSFESLRGPEGLLLLFYRTADW
jgi:hypothetical protein